MGKQRKGGGMQRGQKSEFSMEDRLKKENKLLKRENSRLRKLLSRVDLERFSYLEEVIKKQREEDKLLKNKKRREKQREKWRCSSCGKGYLVPRLMTRRNGDFYYRVCNNDVCKNRTKSQKVTKDTDLSLIDEETNR